MEADDPEWDLQSYLNMMNHTGGTRYTVIILLPRIISLLEEHGECCGENGLQVYTLLARYLDYLESIFVCFCFFF